MYHGGWCITCWTWSWISSVWWLYQSISKHLILSYENFVSNWTLLLSNREQGISSGMGRILETDHRPLEAILRHTSKPPRLIERWVLRIQILVFKAIYRPAKINVAPKQQCFRRNEKPFERIWSILKRTNFNWRPHSKRMPFSYTTTAERMNTRSSA